MNRIVLLSIFLFLFVTLACGAPRPKNDRQLSFDDNDNNNDDDNIRPRGFVQRIFDIIKNLFGLQTRRTVTRSDGTVVEIEPENEGFMSRVTRRILNIVARIFNTFTNRRDDDDDIGRTIITKNNEDSRYRVNEIERELIRKKPESNVVLS